MMHPLTELQQYCLQTSDGRLCRLRDLMFNRDDWRCRRLAVQPDGMDDAAYLISPHDVDRTDSKQRLIRLQRSEASLMNDKPVSLDRPLSIQMERRTGDPLMDAIYDTSGSATTTEKHTAVASAENPDLYSAVEMIGFTVHTSDGWTGQVDDLVVDDRHWSVRYLIIEAADWLLNRRIIINPFWTAAMSRFEKKITVRLTRRQVAQSSPYRPEQLHSHRAPGMPIRERSSDDSGSRRINYS